MEIHSNVISDFYALQRSYLELPWYKKMFFSGRLANTLINLPPDGQLTLHDAEGVCFQFERAWFSRLWFQCLANFSRCRVAQTYHWSVQTSQPVLYFLWLWRPLQGTAQQKFHQALSLPDPYLSVRNNEFELRPQHEISRNGSTTNAQPSAQTAIIRPSIHTERPRPDPNAWRQRANSEKKQKLIEKKQALVQYIDTQISSLLLVCTPYLENRKHCDRLKTDLYRQGNLMRTANKLSHYESYQEMETYHVQRRCLCGRTTFGMSCALCHSPVIISQPLKKLVTKQKPVYTPDEEARSEASIRHATIQAAIQELSTHMTTTPEEYVLMQNLEKIKQRLSHLNNHASLPEQLSAYKTLLDELANHLVTRTAFRKRDYLPCSEYAFYGVVAKIIHRDGLFQQLPDALKKNIATFTVSSDISNEDRDAMFNVMGPQ